MSHPHEAVFLQAFDEHADALFRHACLRLPDRERARDLTQETFIKAWDYVVAGNEVRIWKSFLYRVLNNLIIDEYRRVKPVSLDALVEESGQEAPALLADEGWREIEETLDETRALEAIRVIIRHMPEPHQSVLTLRYIDGLSPQEAAEALGVSENVVSVRAHRALARLKALCIEQRIT